MAAAPSEKPRYDWGRAAQYANSTVVQLGSPTIRMISAPRETNIVLTPARIRRPRCRTLPGSYVFDGCGQSFETFWIGSLTVECPAQLLINESAPHPPEAQLAAADDMRNSLSLDLTFDSWLIYHRPYAPNLLSFKFVEYVLSKGNPLPVHIKAKELPLRTAVED